MSSDVWQKRLIYVGLSLFLAWHTVAIAIAPAPDGSEAAQSLRAVFDPYLTLFRLNNKWDFYAPNIGKGHQLRYVIEDAAAQRHTFVPADELGWYSPIYWWVRAWYDAIIESPQDHGDTVASLFCRKHAALRPVWITLLKLDEEEFSPADQLTGTQPLDAP